MRTFIPYLLVAFLTACPLLCRAELLGCCADRAEVAGMPVDSRTAEPEQNEAGSCICAGAIRASDSQHDSKTGLGDWALDLLPLANFHASLWILPPFARTAAPPGRPECGPLRVHLMLQTLRC